ncbi:MAG: hypothetical protein WC989_02870 [Micavibrio sp.]
MKSGLYRSLFIFIAAFTLAACSEKPAISEAGMAELVFIKAGENKVIDRHGRCLLIQDLSEPKAHEGYALSTVKATWLVLEEGDRNTGDASHPMRISACR